MTKQLLIYERAVPLSSEEHRSLYVKTGTDYSFAREVNAVPLLAPEFANAARHYAIVFAGEDDVMPVALLGFRPEQNLFVEEEGGWTADYIPAFVRQYPFVVSSRDDEQNFALCIDDSYAGCNYEGRGERLFDDDGQRTSFLQQTVARAGEYQGHFRRTRELCNKLRDLGLLTAKQARIRVASGEEVVLTGLMTIDRDRLQALDIDRFKELMANDQLELAYLHLLSLINLRRYADMGPAGSDWMPQTVSSAPEPDASKWASNKNATVH